MGGRLAVGRNRPHDAAVLDTGRGRGDDQLTTRRRRRRRSTPQNPAGGGDAPAGIAVSEGADRTAAADTGGASDSAKRPKGAGRAARIRRMKTEHHRSAGGLVVHSARILLIATQKGRRWQLPKGHIEEGETPEQTAVREVREETGVTGRVVAPLPGVEYWFVEKGPCRVHKKVDYFLLDYVGGHSMDFDPEEVSGTGWFSWEAGIARLTFENERKVVRRAKELLDGPENPESSGNPENTEPPVPRSTEQAVES